MIKLSVLDQSPIAFGNDAGEALKETVQLAQAAEAFGYHRFWVSEHHDTNMLAGSSPEILLSHIGAKTERIRIGSGGVMLPHYSSYKVAENFKVLEALYPNRIDLGIGRAPGGMPIATRALQEGKVRSIDRYSEQVSDLVGYVTDTTPKDHRFFGLKATPVVSTVPDFWLLGSSNGSAAIAAEQGLPFMFAQFINGEGGEHVVQTYQQEFKASPFYTKPNASVALFLVCAPTDEEANDLVRIYDSILIALEQGKRLERVPTVEEARAATYTMYEQARIIENRKRMIFGNPINVKKQIETLAARYGVNEVMVCLIMPSYQHRHQALQLLADVMGMAE